jgi:hypothetical protein
MFKGPSSGKQLASNSAFRSEHPEHAIERSGMTDSYTKPCDLDEFH